MFFKNLHSAKWFGVSFGAPPLTSSVFLIGVSGEKRKKIIPGVLEAQMGDLCKEMPPSLSILSAVNGIDKHQIRVSSFFSVGAKGEQILAEVKGSSCQRFLSSQNSSPISQG